MAVVMLMAPPMYSRSITSFIVLEEEGGREGEKEKREKTRKEGNCNHSTARKAGTNLLHFLVFQRSFNNNPSSSSFPFHFNHTSNQKPRITPHLSLISLSSVAVHHPSLAGISRSAAVVMAYLMHARGLACALAFRLLKKEHRPAW